MTEHKKMYKAGKRWVVATLAVASIAVAGATVNSRVAHADTVSGTETQQVSNTVNTNNEDNDPRITVVSGDQNQAQRDNLQQQAQDLQQQVEDSNANLNNTQEQLKQYQQQQAANDQSIKDDQDQIDRGQQLVDQAKQNKTNRITELRRQKDANNTATMKLAAESTSNTNKIKDLQSKYTSLQKQYATVSHKYFSGDYSLKPEVDQLDNDMNTMWQTIHTLQLDGIDLIDKMNKYTDSNLTLGKEIDALVDDANPYLSEDKDRYEQGQKLVEQYTKQLAIDQAKSSLADQIRSLQNSIRNFSDQLNQTKEKLDQLNVQIAALPAVFQIKKDITRHIIINLPGGSQKSLNQVATITGMKTVTNGQTAYSNWTTATWQAFTAPWDFGAEYIAPSLPAQTVDNSTAEQTITLSYTVAGDFTKENYGKLNTVLITPSMGGDLVRLGLEGWHVAGAALNHAYIIVKDQQTGQVVATTSYQPLDSQEAQHSYPQITNSAHAGFSVVLNIPRKALNDPLEVIARYANGDSYDTGSLNADYSFAPIKADMGNHAWLDQCTFVNGKLHVAGWHATNQAPGATHTIILFDATRHCEIGRTTVGNDLRNDVQAVYPTIYNAGYSGFSADFDVTPGMVGDQLQIISRWSGNDTNTNYVDYWFPAKVMMSGEDNNAYLDQAKVINNHFIVAGWHATNQAAGRQYHTIILFDTSQHRELGRVSVVPAERRDVANAFPQTFNAGKSGFNASFDLLSEMATDNIQVISRWSKSQDANTDYVDYWFAPQRLLSDENNAWLDQVSFATNQLHVAGWHAANQAVGRPYHTIIIFDASQHRELGRKTVSLTERNDVARAFPQIITAGKSGFNASFDLLPEMAADNIQIISRWSKFQDANTDYVDYWFTPQRLLTDQSNRAALDGVSSYNGQLVVAGWHATNQALGKKHHYIIVIDSATGKEIARQLVNAGTARPDVRRAFPGIANADQSGFQVAFAPDNALTQANQLTIISRWTDDQGGNGNYVDYWFAPVTKPVVQDNVGKLESERYAWDTLGVAGWHATDQSLAEPYRTLILIDNTLHKEVARQSITSVSRPDIAKKYPNIAGAGNSGFDTHFKVNGADPTHDFTLISRHSATRDANENYTDYDFHLGQLW